MVGGGGRWQAGRQGSGKAARLLPGQVPGHAGGLAERRGEQPKPLLAHWKWKRRGAGHSRRGREEVPGGECIVGGCASVSRGIEQKSARKRMGVPLADGGGMGECLPGRAAQEKA